MDIPKTTLDILKILPPGSKETHKVGRILGNIDAVLTILRQVIPGIILRSVQNGNHAHHFDRIVEDFLKRAADLALHAHAWTLTVENTPETVNEGGKLVIIANHPDTDGMWVFQDACHKVFGSTLTFLAKYDPPQKIDLQLFKRSIEALVAKVLESMDKAILLHRQESTEANLGRIQENTRRTLKDGTSLIVYPDGHRPTESNQEADKKRYRSLSPDIGTWMTETNFPRCDGLVQLLEQIKDLSGVRLINATVLEPANGGTFRITFKDLNLSVFLNEESKVDRDKVSQWLIAEWKRKNEWIRETT